MQANQEMLLANKEVVLRFNKQVLEQGDAEAFRELMGPDFVNRTAAPGTHPGAEGIWHTLNGVLRRAFPDMRVEIHEQIAEGDKVTTRKTIHATHRGELFGIVATNQRIAIQVIDIVRLENGQYAEHWGINTLSNVVASLRESSEAPTHG